jgi:L-ascorbate metabolism protein UlaG (beta-lactamase superfamily)
MLELSENLKLFWLGHASFRLEADGKTIYFDPWKVKKDKADLIFITHSHFDHLSLDDIRKVQKKETVIVATRDSATKLKGDVKVLRPGDNIEIEGIRIEAVPSYNVGKNFHPKANGWVGYIVTINGKRLYHTGDSDAISEMRGLSVDVALLPIGGTYTMTAEEAADIANEFKPKLVVPMHWGEIVGSKVDAERFRELFNGETVILEPES